MYIHLIQKYLHMSIFFCTFVVEKETLITIKKRKRMKTYTNIKQHTNADTLHAIWQCISIKGIENAHMIYDADNWKLLHEQTHGYYGIEIMYRDNTCEHMTMTTNYSMAKAETEDLAHSMENRTKKTPHHVNLFLLNQDGTIYALIHRGKARSRWA